MKAIRHFERMNDEKHRIRVPLVHKIYETSLTVQEYDSNLCRIAPVEKITVVDYVAEKRDYKVTDFTLENLIAVGAVSGLTPTTLSGDTMQSMRNMEKHLKSMEKEITPQTMSTEPFNNNPVNE